MKKRLECRSYTYAVIRKNKESDPDECIVYISSDFNEAKEHKQNYYQNYDWSDVVYSLVEIWGHNMCPVLEFDTDDATEMN